ncbi:Hermansky-Pudlak syndrome 3 protein isoform X2 [Brienomyrus brachyistius]|uniref:Hermansky-Pudlak syndrome 3 protein isoform X2 n=1 Tax=Brienomyrus brachyistius TaxID=42636 RepID=UPI0020B3B380|nr:Hermansky-Pudlak syndrome 3 protein isoform X2 [Brienomyrus brachyistius]
MVHVYNCHPFASQQIVPTEQEPGLVCCGGDALFVVSAGGCKIEAYQMLEETCSFICRFSTMGSVKSIAYNLLGDYLVTIEEKNMATYLRAYTNWRYQAAEKTRVGVRLLGHLLRSSSFRGAPKEQMEIIEIPLVEPPLCVACCPLTGDLLVGCSRSLVLFSLKRQTVEERLCMLDFERLLVLHVPGWTPSQVAFCAGYVALQTDLEVLVIKLENLRSQSVERQERQEQQERQEHCLLPYDIVPAASNNEDSDGRREKPEAQPDSDDFFMLPKHQEMLGEDAKDSGVSVSLEWTAVEREIRSHLGLTYILYRRFAPDFFEGCHVEDTRLHSLQLLPVFTAAEPGIQEGVGVAKETEPTCIFCFFSLPNSGYMYSIRNTVELISTYQYPEKAQQAVLSQFFLHVITRNALQCFSVRCSAVAARAVDPYIDTTMRACPAYTMEVCALRIQLFIGLKTVCHDRNHIVLLTAADLESKEETEKVTRRTMSRKTSAPKPKEPSEGSHGWNLYVVNTVPIIPLYREMVEYSRNYEATNPLSQSCIHLLSEAHLLLRAALLDRQAGDPADGQQLEEAFRESCAQLGDCYSRFDKRDCHLALPYYKMSALSVTDVILRNVAFARTMMTFGRGFLFFLKHSLYEESMDELSEETANLVLDIFASTELAQLPHIINSPIMRHGSPASALPLLEKLEAEGGPSVTVTLTKAALHLRLGNLQQYKQEMDRHTEMLQVYGYIEEPKLLLHGRGKAIVPTALAQKLKDTQDGLLVAAMVALHENSKICLEEADLFFLELCKGATELESGPQLLVDFWESLLVASTSKSVIQELLFRLASVYIDRIAKKKNYGMKPLKTTDDLINSCCHYGQLFPWVSVLTPLHFNVAHDHHEDLQKLQSLLCGPTLDVSFILPLLEQLSDRDSAGLSVHVLCTTKLGHHERSIDRLLDLCPQAVLPYAIHQLHHDKTVLWWKKLFPELCDRTRATGGKDDILLTALKETLKVVAMELSPLELLNLLPDDGTAQFFLPYLLECGQKHLLPA